MHFSRLNVFGSIGLCACLVMIAGLLSPVSTSDFLNSQPVRNLFKDGKLNDCAACETLIVIVSEKTLNPEIYNSFRRISIGLGKKHAGVVMSRNEAFESFLAFKNYGCPRLDRFNQDFVVYIDRDEMYCDATPYQNIAQLRASVSIILENLGNARKIGVDNWVISTQNLVKDYGNKRKVDRFVTEFFVKLIVYIGHYAK